MTMKKHHWKPRRCRVQEGFEKAAVHTLQHAIIEDAGFEFGNGLSLEEVQVFGRHDRWGEVGAARFTDLIPGLCEQDSLGSDGLAHTGAADPGDGVLPHGG